MDAFIFARGGSKGIPNKNIIDINGITLLERTVKTLKEAFEIKDIYISTDSEKIMNEGIRLDIKTIKRPYLLATDKSNEIDSWKHMCNTLKYNEDRPFMVTPVTSPLRSTEDISNAINKWNKGKYDVVLSRKESTRNPYLNMVTKNAKNEITTLSKDNELWRRQDCPKFWDVLTVVYITTLKRINMSNNLIGKDTGWVEIPSERAIDIDNLYDLKIARLLDLEEAAK